MVVIHLKHIWVQKKSEYPVDCLYIQIQSSPAWQKLEVPQSRGPCFAGFSCPTTPWRANKWDFGQPNSGFYPLVKKNRFLLKMAIYSGFTMIYLFKIMVSRGYVSLPKGKWNWTQGPISDFPSEQLPDWKAVDTLGWWPILKNSLSQALTWVETETLWWSKSQSYEKFPRNLQDGHPSSRPRQNDWLWSTESFSIA